MQTFIRVDHLTHTSGIKKEIKLMSDQKYTVDALENLIETARDGQNGYRDGAEHAKDPQLKKFLESVSLARAGLRATWKAMP